MTLVSTIIAWALVICACVFLAVCAAWVVLISLMIRRVRKMGLPVDEMSLPGIVSAFMRLGS